MVNGTINRCTVALDYPENQVGFLGLDGVINLDEAKNNMWFENILLEECYNCKRILACTNGECPLDTVVNSKSHCGVKIFT